MTAAPSRRGRRLLLVGLALAVVVVGAHAGSPLPSPELTLEPRPPLDRPERLAPGEAITWTVQVRLGDAPSPQRLVLSFDARGTPAALLDHLHVSAAFCPVGAAPPCPVDLLPPDLTLARLGGSPRPAVVEADGDGLVVVGVRLDEDAAARQVLRAVASVGLHVEATGHSGRPPAPHRRAERLGPAGRARRRLARRVRRRRAAPGPAVDGPRAT